MFYFVAYFKINNFVSNLLVFLLVSLSCRNKGMFGRIYQEAYGERNKIIKPSRKTQGLEFYCTNIIQGLL